MKGRFWFRFRRRGYAVGRLIALFLSVTLLVVGLTAAARLRPLLEQLAVARVSNSVTGVVSQAVYEAVESGEIRYDELVSFEKDNEGKITAVRSNMAACNHLQADILEMVHVEPGNPHSEHRKEHKGRQGHGQAHDDGPAPAACKRPSRHPADDSLIVVSQHRYHLPSRSARPRCARCGPPSGRCRCRG